MCIGLVIIFLLIAFCFCLYFFHRLYLLVGIPKETMVKHGKWFTKSCRSYIFPVALCSVLSILMPHYRDSRESNWLLTALIFPFSFSDWFNNWISVNCYVVSWFWSIVQLIQCRFTSPGNCQIWYLGMKNHICIEYSRIEYPVAIGNIQIQQLSS